MLKKITFGKAALKVLLFEVILQIFVWAIIIFQLLKEFHSNPTYGKTIDFHMLSVWSHNGIVENGGTVFVIISILTAIFVFFSYFKHSDKKIGKKLLNSIFLIIIGVIFFAIIYAILYSYIIGNDLP